MALTTQPFAHIKELDTMAPSKVNVADAERMASVLGGIAVTAYGISQRSAITPLALFLGGLLIFRGASGRCELYRKLGVDTSWPRQERGVPGDRGINVEKSVEIDRASPQVYSYWRALENLPKFMPHLRSVTETADGISHWVVAGPVGSSLEWDAEIINDHPGEMIAWQTLPGAHVQSAGTVRFEPINQGHGTRVTVSLQYQPPLGSFGAAAARVFGESPEQQLSSDLARFKSLIETDSDTSAA